MRETYSSLAIIIPSYKELKNLDILLTNIEAVVCRAHVYIVDDSPEKYVHSLEQLINKKRSINIVLISRGKKLGRGSAVFEGMKKALENKKIQYVIEMDADLAHDPKEIPLLFSKIDTADMVIGSRYLNGSNIKDWPIQRLLQSKIINFSLRYWLGIPISDFTNGFRLYRRKAAEFLVYTTLYEKGFIALSEIAYQLKKHGFTIAEVPTSFTDRKFGVSNAGLRELFMSLAGAIRIRLRS